MKLFGAVLFVACLFGSFLLGRASTDTDCFETYLRLENLELKKAIKTLDEMINQLEEKFYGKQ